MLVFLRATMTFFLLQQYRIDVVAVATAIHSELHWSRNLCVDVVALGLQLQGVRRRVANQP
jgi:hypothetical protein